jgi:hypothetical protein
MTLKESQALTNPFVRCRDGRIGQIIRMRAGYAADDPTQDAVGVAGAWGAGAALDSCPGPHPGAGWPLSGNGVKRTPVINLPTVFSRR